MAIDTANKRGSVLGMLPIPDGGGVDNQEPQQVLGLYSGIAGQAQSLPTRIPLSILCNYYHRWNQYSIAGAVMIWRNNQLWDGETMKYILRDNVMVAI